MFNCIKASAVAMICFLPLHAAAACKEVRLDKNGGPFEKIPVYDQSKFSIHDPGICYAVTASELIDADRFYRDGSLDRLTSPLSIAARYKILFNEGEKNSAMEFDSLGSGDIRGALEAVSSQNVCDQKYLERFAPLTGKIVRNPLPSSQLEENFVSSTPNFLKSLSKMKLDLDNEKKRKKKRQGRQVVAAACRNTYIEARLIDDENIADILSVLVKSLRADQVAKQVSGVLNKLCASHSFKLAPIKMKEFYGATEEEEARETEIRNKISRTTDPKEFDRLQDELSNVFDPSANINERMVSKVQSLLESEHPVPVGITYNARVLYGDNEQSRHASVIVGQRAGEGGKCEFLVRNSYGPQCSSGSGPYAYPCENGSIWVPADTLMEKTDNLNWVAR